MQRRGILIALVLVAVGCGGSAGAAGPAGSNARPLQHLTLQLDWYPNPDHVGVYVAIDRGFFARAGLAVKPIAPASVSDAIKLVAAGRVDLGISYEPELFFAQQQHIPAVAVAAVVPTALNSVIGRRDRGITSVADLRGKTIGVDGSSSTNAYLSAVLRTAGIEPTTGVKRVTVGFNLVPAILSGRVDAIAGGFQNIEGIDVAAQGVPVSVFPVDRHGVPDYDELVLIADPRRLRSDPAYAHEVAGFVHALASATTWARRHPAAATAVMQRQSYPGYRKELARSVPATLRLLRTSALSPSAWNRFGDWMYRAGLLAARPDGAALVARP